jgi:CRP-like cAMP-binding protein
VTKTDQTTSIATFFSQFTAFELQADEVLIHTGEPVNFVYYLSAGIVKQVAVSPQGQENTITFYKEGSFFPLIWAVKDTPAPYDFKTVTEVNGWKAPKAEVIKFLKHNAEVTFDLCLRLLSGLEGLGRKVEYALQASASLRISEALLTLAYRFSHGSPAQRTIELNLTHQNLAEITGLTRETVSRELKLLRQKGLIADSDQVFIIPDLLALERSVRHLTDERSAGPSEAQRA